jgi:hypothetical protein
MILTGRHFNIVAFLVFSCAAEKDPAAIPIPPQALAAKMLLTGNRASYISCASPFFAGHIIIQERDSMQNGPESPKVF